MCRSIIGRIAALRKRNIPSKAYSCSRAAIRRVFIWGVKAVMPKEFRKYVADTISRLKSEYGLADDTTAFAHWAICHASDLHERDVFDDVYVGSKDDMSLDGFHVDPEQKEIHLHQCKYHTSESNYDDRAALDEFVKVLERLKDEKSSKEFKSAAIRSAARVYREEAIADRYNVIMKFIIYATPTPSVTNEVRILRKSLPPKHSLEIWDFRRLENTYYERFAWDDPITEPVTLPLVNTKYAGMETVKANAVVVNIPAVALYDLRKKYSRRLFAQDVRYYLPKSQINKAIASTLESPSQREYFWFYNNGISISCNDYSISRKKKTIAIVEPQIINGCQTVESIFNFGDSVKHGRHNLEKVAILARVIKISSKDKNLGADITARTNTQNPQTARNLCANLISQVRLKNRFNELVPPVFYQTKDGEWESLPTHKKDRHTSKEGMIRKIDNRDAAQAYIAFARDDKIRQDKKLNPVEARRLRSILFDQTKAIYRDVFPDELRTPYEYLVPCLFLTYVEKRIRSILKEVGEHVHGEQDEEERVQDEIKASARYAKWFIVGILGWLVTRHYGPDANYPAVAKALYPVIGDFESPSELGKHMLDFAFNVIEEYSDEQTRRDEEEEEQKREEFDPALAYRQEHTWNSLKRKVARNYRRENEDGRFRGDLFPKLS